MTSLMFVYSNFFMFIRERLSVCHFKSMFSVRYGKKKLSAEHGKTKLLSTRNTEQRPTRGKTLRTGSK